MGAVLISVAINAALVLIAFAYFRAKINATLSGDRLLNDLRDEVNHLVVELNGTTERNLGLFEERVAKLQDLIRDADKKILVLSREGEKHKLGTDVYDKLKRAVPLVAKPREPIISSNEASVAQPEKSEANIVLDLYRKGFDPKLIASKTGSSLGEVELIISLEDQKK